MIGSGYGNKNDHQAESGIALNTMPQNFIVWLYNFLYALNLIHNMSLGPAT